MAMWPFGSKAPQSDSPKLVDSALSDLSRMFLSDTENPTPGGELIDVHRFDLSVESLGLMDHHLDVMREKNLTGQDLFRFILRAGAYVGEVIRRHAAPATVWHWIDYEEAVKLDRRLTHFGKGIGTVAVLWDGQRGFIFPLAKVGKYLENGPEDSVKFYAQVIIAGPRSESP